MNLSSFTFFVIGGLNPNVILELFSMYREWQVEKAKKMSQKQVLYLHKTLLYTESVFRSYVLKNITFKIITMSFHSSFYFDWGGERAWSTFIRIIKKNQVYLEEINQARNSVYSIKGHNQMINDCYFSVCYWESCLHMSMQCIWIFLNHWFFTFVFEWVSMHKWMFFFG